MANNDLIRSLENEYHELLGLLKDPQTRNETIYGRFCEVVVELKKLGRF